MLTPEQRVESIREAMDRGRSSQFGDGGPEAIAEQIREAVAAEWERCAKVAESLPWAAWEMGDGRIARIVAAIRDGQPAVPQWTTDPPTVPGWYWYRDEDIGPVNCLKVWSGDGMHVDYQGNSYLIEDWAGQYPGEWCGPLEVPQ